MQTPEILLIQFRAKSITAQLEESSIARELGTQIKLVCISALDQTIEWNNPTLLMDRYAGVILGGSGDFDFDGGRSDDDTSRATSYTFLEKLRPLLDYIFQYDIPTLGICYGHQIIGAYAGAKVIHDETQKKNRSHEVSVVVDKDAYSICAGVPEAFHAYYGHKDSLDRVPEGATLLMCGGVACQVSALSYKQNIFSTQFHPELTIDDLKLRMEATPGYLPEGVNLEEVFKDDAHANTILRNFGLFVQVDAERIG